jgi:hypothetical protein
MKISGRLPYRVLIKLFNKFISNTFTSLLPEMISKVVSYLVSQLNYVSQVIRCHISDGVTVEKYSELAVVRQISSAETPPTQTFHSKSVP